MSKGFGRIGNVEVVGGRDLKGDNIEERGRMVSVFMNVGRYSRSKANRLGFSR